MESELRRNGAHLDQFQFPEKPFIRSFAEVVVILNDSLFSCRKEFKNSSSDKALCEVFAGDLVRIYLYSI